MECLHERTTVRVPHRFCADCSVMVIDFDATYYPNEDGTDRAEYHDEWVHDPARDGAGCGWCGAWTQVDSEGFCQDCWVP